MKSTLADKLQIMRRILLDVQKLSPTAIIAGGAIRDTILSHPVKDVDIFIEATNDDMFNYTFWKSTIAMMSPKNKNNENDHSDLANGVEQVLCGIQLGYKIDLVLVDQPPISHVNDMFDIGLCKTYFTGTQVVLTEDFNYDRLNKTLTVVQQDIDFDEYLHTRLFHCKRVKTKYPDYTIQAAQCNKHHEIAYRARKHK
jgi:hypothetical protein